MKNKAILITCIVLTAILLFIAINPNDQFPPDIFGWNRYSCTWLDSLNNVQFYSAGYAGKYYCGVIYPYNDFQFFISNINAISKSKIKIGEKVIRLPKGNNIVLIRPDMNFIFLHIPEKYFIKDGSSQNYALNIEELKKDGIWDSKISPNLNAEKATSSNN